MTDEVKPVRHIIGCARTIQTAVLVCEYLKQRCGHPQSVIPGDCIKYAFKNPTPDNGYWSADILVTTYGDCNKKQDKAIIDMVDVCRAFVAGRGEVWA